jgi:uncharacterized protein YgiM (DUF1202 family)
MNQYIVKTCGICALSALLAVAAPITASAALTDTGVAGATVSVNDYYANPENTPIIVQNTTVVTEAANAEELIAGYTNLGIANVENHLNVREAATTDSKIVGNMPKNAGCEIIGQEGEWYQIKSGKVEGYVLGTYLLTGEEAKAKALEVCRKVAVVNTTTLKVRENPGLDTAVLTLIPIGEELEVEEELDGWIKVTVDSDVVGYISTEYVDISTELDKAVTMQELEVGADGSGVSSIRAAVVSYAKQFLGNRYVYGGTSLTNGTDCSGFTMSVLAHFGYGIARTSGAQSNCGTNIGVSEALPGDLIFYSNGGRINHVAMYIGNGQVIHASNPRSGIKISNVYYRTPVKATRIIK